MSGALAGRRLFGSLLFGDSDYSDYSDYSDGSSYSYSQPSAGSSSYSSGGSSDFSGGSSGYSDFSSFFSAIQSPYSTLNQGSSSAAEYTDSSSIDTSVASGARSKRTEIYGKGLDNVTIMVYMCGTDLESKSAMATKDLVEMTRATLGGNVQILVYTGGCTKWNNNVVSSQYNQLYQVADGGLKCLVSNAGTGSMTNPDTLADFILWCAENYPANRNELILWDHGGGSVSGFGYDQKYARSGSREFARSMAIDQIDLVDFANRLDSKESRALADALRSAVKYNRTSSDMTNAYGLSIYFPYRKHGNVDKAVKTYDAIGMDASYSQCIRDFASLEASGQAAWSGPRTPTARRS